MLDTRVHPWMTHPRTGAPLRPLGYRANGRPIWPIMGASEDDGDEGGDDSGGDDEGDDEGAGDDEGDDEGAGDDPDAGKTPEELRAELKAVRASKAKLLREAKNRTKAPPKDKDGKDTLTREDFETMREETRAAARAEVMPALIRTAARSQLESLGMVFPKDAEVAKAKLTRVLKLADTEELELGDYGEIEGLEHALRQVKRVAPELFRGKTPPRAGNEGGSGRPGNKPRTATELQAAAIFGGGDDDD